MLALASLRAGLALLGLAAFAAGARATPLDFLPVGDPLEEELRALEIAGATAPLPHFGTRPLQRIELPAWGDTLPAAAAVGVARLRRALARDGLAAETPGATRRLFQRAREEQRFEVSAGLEGGGRVGREEPSLVSPSGLRLRVGAQSGRWAAHTHLILGFVEGGLDFAEAIFEEADAIAHSEETWIAYTGPGTRWAVQAGRSRWHWGPGQESSLLLSRTSAPLTGAAFRLRLEALRADASLFHATLGLSAGEQLAAHRLEWQPVAGLRLGVAEAVRYQSSSWSPLYALSVLPYSLVQNLLVQDEPDSAGRLRNNVAVSVDAAWRPAPGTRFHAEVLVDDLRTGEGGTADKYGYQLGWEGVGTVRGRRVTWGTEYTRLSRFVYTSFFGRSFAAHGQPLGYFTGPDSRRLRARAAWDPAVDWQVFAAAARTERGESGLDEPFVPGATEPEAGALSGVVERSRELELGLRWWPAAGTDLTLAGGYQWVDDLAHVPGSRRREARATLGLRWTR